MKTRHVMQMLFLILIMSTPAVCAFGAAAEIKNVKAIPEGDTVHIAIELTSPVKPIVRTVGEPSRLIIEFPNVSLSGEPREIVVNQAGVKQIQLGDDVMELR